MSDIYLSLTETPAVVTLSQPVIASSVAATVTVGNTVTVALDANSLSALENVTVTVGAAISGTVTVANFPASQTVQGTVTVASLPAISGSVTVNNFPSTQTIAGTVTANLSSTNLSAVTIGVRGSVLVFGQSFDQGTGTLIDESPLPLIDSGEIAGDGVRVAVALVDQLGNALGTDISTPIVAMVSNPVTIGSLPAISGTVTANITNSVTVGAIIGPAGGSCLQGISGSGDAVRIVLQGRDSAGNYSPIVGSGVNQYNIPIYGTVTVGNTVTVSALPSGALTTRFGSVTTASVAQLTSCVTNTSRKYLLAQNISTGSVTIGIGFSPTTTQGIQLTAGAGLTFDAFCPTGAVYWLGAVTGAAWTILEA